MGIVQAACLSFTVPLGAEPGSEFISYLGQASVWRPPGIPNGYPAQI